MNSYAGKILHVNLSTCETKIQPLTAEAARLYIGGVGLSLRLLMDNSRAGVDAFGPENPLVFGTGPLTGTIGAAGGTGYAVVSKSPATGAVAWGIGFSFFGAELKRAGYDAIVMAGKAPKLSYLWIDDDKIQLLNAEKLKNVSASKTQSIIRDELGDFYIRVCCVGEAGEKLCRFASLVDDEQCSFGRGGLGAVMGSKNLKAIAIRGTQDVNVANLAGFRDFVKAVYQRTKASDLKCTAENVALLNSVQALATRNWANSTFEGADKLSGKAFTERYIKRAASSTGLTCGSIVQVPDGPYKGATARIGFDVLSSLGALCGVDQPDAIIEAARLTNEYGLDPVSTGATVAFAMDLYEQGLIGKKQTDGLDLKFGNAQALIGAVGKISRHEGWLGTTLSEGVAKATEVVGKDAAKYACTVKGLELAGYDLRSLKTAALASAVSFGGNLYSVASDVDGKTDRFAITQGRGVADQINLCNVMDSLLICQSGLEAFPNGLSDLANYYILATGNPVTVEELALVGERIENLARLFNVREGLSRKDDALPWKLTNVPVSDNGPAKGARVSKEEFELGLNDHYNARGWTHEGVPTKATLEKLQLTQDGKGVN